MARRKKSSKCLSTSPYSLENAPFKDSINNGINFDHCIHPRTPHIMMRAAIKRLEENCLERTLEDILKVGVGVDRKGLMNEVLERETNYRYFLAELQNLLKLNSHLEVFIYLSRQRVNSSVPNDQIFSQKIVYQMLYFIACKVIPLRLLGSKENFKKFLKLIRIVVYGSHHQRFSLSSMVLGFKVSHVSWLQQSLPSNSLRLHVMACLVKWLLLYVQNVIHKIWSVVPRSSKEMVFYERVQWEKVEKAEIDRLVLSKSIRPIGEHELEYKVRHTGRTHFLIKSSGLRPITVFKKPQNDADRTLIQNAKMLVTQFSHFIGSSLTFMSPRIDQHLQNGLLRIIAKHPCPSNRPPYYFVRIDVQDAYGSINHSTLLEILNTAYLRVSPNDNDLKMRNVKLGRKVCVMFESPALVLPPFVVKGNYIKDSDVDPVIGHIREYIAFVATKMAGKLYRIRHGIPQGMPLSAALCELYYTFFDSKYFSEFKDGGDDELFIRYCDDYFFLTPHKERAEKFFQLTHVNFPDKGVRFNTSKSLTNLTSNLSIVSFCGYFLDMNTFHLQSNFMSFANKNVASSLNLTKTGKPGRLILYRMKIILKLSPALLDKRINSKFVAMTNIYQASLLLAFRFYAYVNCYIPVGKLNQAFVVECIKKGVRVMRSRVIKGIAKSYSGEWMSRDEIKLVVLKAFLARILKGGGAHQYPKIKNYLIITCGKISCTLQPLQKKFIESVCSPPLPPVFRTMK